MITLLPLTYRKFFPFGSPLKTIRWPRWVLGKVAKSDSEIMTKTKMNSIPELTQIPSTKFH